MNRLIDWLIDWPIGHFDWLIDWFTDCVAFFSSFSPASPSTCLLMVKMPGKSNKPPRPRKRNQSPANSESSVQSLSELEQDNVYNEELRRSVELTNPTVPRPAAHHYPPAYRDDGGSVVGAPGAGMQSAMGSYPRMPHQQHHGQNGMSPSSSSQQPLPPPMQFHPPPPRSVVENGFNHVGSLVEKDVYGRVSGCRLGQIAGLCTGELDELGWHIAFHRSFFSCQSFSKISLHGFSFTMILCPFHLKLYLLNIEYDWKFMVMTCQSINQRQQLPSAVRISVISHYTPPPQNLIILNDSEHCPNSKKQTLNYEKGKLQEWHSDKVQSYRYQALNQSINRMRLLAIVNYVWFELHRCAAHEGLSSHTW